MKQFSAGLKSSSPLLKQGAPTKLSARGKHFRPGASFGWDFEQSLRWQGLKPILFCALNGTTKVVP